MKQWLRMIPPVHELQKDERFRDLQRRGIPFDRITKLLKEELEQMRSFILEGKWEEGQANPAAMASYVIGRVAARLPDLRTGSLVKVINATGTVLHTNLGRAVLSEEAIHAAALASGNYTNLEYRLDKGSRGSRHGHIEKLIADLTGAESAMAVNNNAAAVYLILSALARKKEVVVSRGELVEIGGSFRISSIMEESGALLKEVGTTNKTHLKDYEAALNEDTAMLLKVHTSNFFIQGFTSSVGLKELSELKERYPHIIVYEDLGSGVLQDLRERGIGREPTVQEAIREGADLISFSGDKLLGGPQAGIIAGKKELIDRLKAHQLARVVRIDKMSLSALGATLLHYYRGEAMEKIPVLRYITTEPDELKSRIERFAAGIDWRNLQWTIEPSKSRIGGGTMPDVELNSYVLAIHSPYIHVNELERRLRCGEDPVIARIQNDRLLFDFRTVEQDEEPVLMRAVERISMLETGAGRSISDFSE